MAVFWYQCKKCATLIKKDTSPNLSGCPKASSHDWKKLAEVGDTNYQCKKCGTMIQAKASPLLSGCPSSSSHEWKRL